MDNDKVPVDGGGCDDSVERRGDGRWRSATGQREWTCADFLSFDEVTRPKIVYWSEGFARKEKTANVAFDVDRDDSLVPQLIEDCTKEPHASYWTTMKRRFMLD